jgi:hypothetical protein
VTCCVSFCNCNVSDCSDVQTHSRVAEFAANTARLRLRHSRNFLWRDSDTPPHSCRHGAGEARPCSCCQSSQRRCCPARWSVNLYFFKHCILTHNTEEINTLRTSLKQARQEHLALETQLRELRSTENSTKVRSRHCPTCIYPLTYGLYSSSLTH